MADQGEINFLIEKGFISENGAELVDIEGTRKRITSDLFQDVVKDHFPENLENLIWTT